jgi:hypothetical protein
MLDNTLFWTVASIKLIIRESNSRHNTADKKVFMQAFEHHLNELRVSSFAVLSAQPLPPKPLLQMQAAEHLKSRIVQDGRLFPEGSR